MTDTLSTRALDSAGPAVPDALLSIEDLRVHFHTDAGVVKAVDGVSWAIKPGETLGIVGESGSGKSVSALSIMGLVPVPPAKFETGKIFFQGRDLLRTDEDELREIRGKDVSMIFQDPLTSLNPVFKVGHQIAEVIQVHEKMGRIPARKQAVDLLAEVGIPNPKQRAQEYPHQFSGGMRQRAMIAMALALDPVLLLADEPTTALDVTVQAQIMDLLLKLQEQRGTAIVLITHDLGLVASHADRVLVMYAGKIVESADVDTVFYEPRHAYTYGLLSSLARLDQRRTERLEPIQGQPPSLIRVPPGCAFHPRCRFATDICRENVPALVPQDRPYHVAACHHSDLVAAAVNGPAAASATKPAARRTATRDASTTVGAAAATLAAPKRAATKKAAPRKPAATKTVAKKTVAKKTVTKAAAKPAKPAKKTAAKPATKARKAR